MLLKVALLLTASLASASDFQADPLSTSHGIIYTLSTFDERDYFTVFTSSGSALWEIPFSSKIISWKIDDNQLYVFSKKRDGTAYFLSCFETQKGGFLWEKPITAPKMSTEQAMMTLGMMESMSSKQETPMEAAPE